MKVLVIAALVVLAVAVSGEEKRQQIGICVEECSPSGALQPSLILRSLGIGTCPDGFVCASNGCGHTCQKVDDHATSCSDVLCALYCTNGFQTDSNGCPICVCQ